MPRLNLEIVSSVYNTFRKNCDDEGRSMSDVVRQLVVGYNSSKQEERYHKRLADGDLRKVRVRRKD